MRLLVDWTTRRPRNYALAAVVAALLAACSSAPKPPPLTAPAWDAVPAAVLDALCTRLRMDAIATGAPLAIVSTTRPIATQQSLSALVYLMRGRPIAERVASAVVDGNRSIPVTTEGSSCAWRAVPAAQLPRLRDEMVIELSAPALHPLAPREAGLFARATVGGEHASWYWVTLVPHGDRWGVAGVSVLSSQ
ncbi:MAG TPA: hypothetical protein VF883_07170 [Thermoanaerobaculia bacterium]